MQKIIITTLLILLSCFLKIETHAFSFSYYTQSNKEKSVSKKTFPNENKYYKVIGIKDGDTIVILVDGKEVVVRLSHIDCPEKKQDYGNKAKEFISNLCFSKTIRVKHNNQSDRNGRILGEIYLSNGKNVNKLLVENGLAWHYKKYSKDNTYASLQRKAQLNKINIWSKPNPIAPWDFRKIRRKK